MPIRRLFYLLPFAFLALGSCKRARIIEHKDWEHFFTEAGVSNGCFMLRDHTHESIHYYNQKRCLQRLTPASTFKIFNSLVGLETGVAQDDNFVIPWDSVVRWNPDWNHSMTMREAFKVSNVAYYQELARRIGKKNMQYYLDTVQYGNKSMGNSVDSFWLDNSLLISADEQVGFLKRLYFEELPFTTRSQSIVKSMMLREDSNDNRLYYKTGTGRTPQGTWVIWIVGFNEHTTHVKEHKESMNKSGERNYPYFFALNFEAPDDGNVMQWMPKRIALLRRLLDEAGATKAE